MHETLLVMKTNALKSVFVFYHVLMIIFFMHYWTKRENDYFAVIFWSVQLCVQLQCDEGWLMICLLTCTPVPPRRLFWFTAKQENIILSSRVCGSSLWSCCSPPSAVTSWMLTLSGGVGRSLPGSSCLRLLARWRFLLETSVPSSALSSPECLSGPELSVWLSPQDSTQRSCDMASCRFRSLGTMVIVPMWVGGLLLMCSDSDDRKN